MIAVVHNEMVQAYPSPEEQASEAYQLPMMVVRTVLQGLPAIKNQKSAELTSPASAIPVSPDCQSCLSGANRELVEQSSPITFALKYISSI